jgi:hypothetical protein
VERQEVLEALERKIQSSGGKLVQTVRSLADELGETPERLYYLIRLFTQNGQLASVSHGPNGMEFRRGTGEPMVTRSAATRTAGTRRAPARRTRAADAPADGVARFCPYCGRALDPAWRFCASCGRELPQTR